MKDCNFDFVQTTEVLTFTDLPFLYIFSVARLAFAVANQVFSAFQRKSIELESLDDEQVTKIVRMG